GAQPRDPPLRGDAPPAAGALATVRGSPVVASRDLGPRLFPQELRRAGPTPAPAGAIRVCSGATRRAGAARAPAVVWARLGWVPLRERVGLRVLPVGFELNGHQRIRREGVRGGSRRLRARSTRVLGRGDRAAR